MASAVYESEVAFISGVAENGTVVGNSFGTMHPRSFGDTNHSLATKWGSGTPGTGAHVTYFFTTASGWTASEKAAWQGGLALWSAVADIKFAEAADATSANFVITRGNDGAFQRYSDQDPSVVGASTLGLPASTGSLISVDTNALPFGPIGQDLVARGGFPLSTVVHEIGHMIGLGHGGLYNGDVAPMVSQFSPYDTTLWTLMSYISPMQRQTKFFDQYPVAGTNWGSVFDAGRNWSYDPLTPMALDILAAQRLYGAATSGPLASGGKVFGFNANIEGYVGRFYDFSINQHPVLTLWSGGTGNTLDLSRFSSDSTINLSPGTFSSAAGLINNIGIAFGTVIETAIGGAGNDTILGTDLRNVLKGGAGNDLIRGGAGNDSVWGDSGNDVLSGGIGADIIDPGTGFDIVRDRLVDLNSDLIMGFGRATTVDITGALIGRDALVVSEFGSTTAIGAGGLSFGLDGLYSGGDFMSVALGSGAGAHTMVTFVTYLPTLVEGLQVNPAAINGIANEPFLSSDGSFGFSASLKTAVSAHSNALGVYKIAADGTIFDVHVVFANTLAVASGATAGLGTPGNGERIGFFLIQDGFDRYGSLPDNLSFIAPEGGTPANANGGTAPVLMSASLGVLSVASVFHSSAGLNPGNAAQVLSGVAPGGRELLIGFEDLPTGTGDNDFQDVVIGVRTNHDGIFFV
jgi:serralysin